MNLRMLRDEPARSQLIVQKKLKLKINLKKNITANTMGCHKVKAMQHLTYLTVKGKTLFKN